MVIGAVMMKNIDLNKKLNKAEILTLNQERYTKNKNLKVQIFLGLLVITIIIIFILFALS